MAQLGTNKGPGERYREGGWWGGKKRKKRRAQLGMNQDRRERERRGQKERRERGGDKKKEEREEGPKKEGRAQLGMNQGRGRGERGRGERESFAPESHEIPPANTPASHHIHLVINSTSLAEPPRILSRCPCLPPVYKCDYTTRSATTTTSSTSFPHCPVSPRSTMKAIRHAFD